MRNPGGWRTIVLAAAAVGIGSMGEAAVSGRVLGADGSPIPGATVEALEHESAEETGERRAAGRSRTPVLTATSAADGSFTIESTRPFAWVQASAAGHAPAIALADDNAPLQIRLTRAPLRRAVLTAGGKPVAGAIVVWFSGEGAERVVRSAPDGSFEAPDPAQTHAQLAVLHADFAPLLAYVGESGMKSLDQQLETGVAITGSAVDHASGRAVADARLWIDDTWPLARTDAKGAFVIPHVARDWTSTTARTPRLVGTAERKPGPVVIRMKASRSLSGTVIDAATRRPLAGASVAVAASRSSAWGTDSGTTSTALTDARGQYTLSGLAAGRYEPYVGRAGYSHSTDETNRTIDLRSAATARFDAALKRLPQVSGRVEDERHRPVEGALVSLGMKGSPNVYASFSGGFNSMFAAVADASSRTAADGSFTLSIPVEPEPGQDLAAALKDRQLLVLKPGFAAAQAAIEVRGTAPAPLVVTLPQGIELQGRVTGADGSPVAGVAVTAAEDGAMSGVQLPTAMLLKAMKDDGWTTSDGAGGFALRVHPTAHLLYFRKTGYAPKLAPNHDPRPGQPLEVVLDPAARVAGRVTRADGRGVADAQVYTTDSFSWHEAAQATTSADGAFEITDLPPGVYKLSVRHEGTGANTSRTVEAPTTDLQIVLAPTVTLRGRVLDAGSRQPVPRYQLALMSGGDQGSSSRNLDAEDPSGAFSLEDVAIGEARLTISAEGYASKAVSDLTLEEGNEPPLLEVLLEAEAAVRGRVTSQGGGPLAEADVSVKTPRDANVDVTTDEDGEYDLRGVAPGELTLEFSAQGYVTETRTLDSRESTRLDVTLKRGLTLKGEVVKAGVGVPNVSVSARSSAIGASDQSVESGEQGRFVIEGLVPGRYTVSAGSRGEGSAKLEDVNPETSGPIRLTLDRAGTAVIHGKVVGLSGEEFGMAMVSATSEETGVSGQAVIDASHAFRMEDAPAGRVKVRAYASSITAGLARSSRTVELNLAPGSETETVLEFASDDNTITGTVTRDGAGVPFVTVGFGGSAEQGGSARADARGVYQVQLEPGSYQVHVYGDHVSFQTEYVVTASAQFDIDVTGGSIAGRAVHADGGAPVSGVEVSFFRVGGGENKPDGSATTGAQGGFSERSLREGRYRLITSKPGYGQEVRDVEVARGATAEVLFELTPAEGVSVTVVDARDSRPLEAIVVVRDQARRIVANRHSGADATGLLNIPLADGSYLLSTSATGYGTVTVPVTAPTQGLRLGLTPGGTLVIESSRDLKGRVRLVQPDGEEYVRCWCNGIAEIQLKGRRTSVENVTPGSYTVEIVDSPEATSPRAVVIREGQTSTVAIE